MTSGALSKLLLYRAKGVPEVWIWQDGSLSIRVLTPGGYEAREHSALLPDLEVPLLARFVTWPDQYDAVRAFRKALHSRMRKD